MTEPPSKPKRTRNRIPQSCQPCRKRKLKCDRQHPACQNCIKRGIEGACEYAEPPEDEKTRALRRRLEELEQQVHEISSALARGESSQSPETEEDPEIQGMVQQFSLLRMRKKEKTVYYGPNARFAIAHEFPEIFKGHGKRTRCKEMWRSTEELLRDESIITAFLPIRDLCDQLVGRYFECCNSVFNIIDADDYWEEYRQLWANDPSPRNSFLSITFFIIAIASRSLNEGHQLVSRVSSEGVPGALKAANRWKKYGELALSQTGLLNKSSVYLIQALLLLSILETEDHTRWNLLGLIGNMARVAGLHRDPNVFPALGDKERAVRRRLWSYIYILDQFEAVGYGYSANIAEETYDCEPFETAASDPQDPDNTFLYWFFKLHRIMSASFPGPLGLQKNLVGVNKNDVRIREFLEQLPPELHISNNYTPLFGESPLEIIRRYAMATSIQGLLLTVHRPYSSKSSFSKDAVMTAACALTIYQNQVIALSESLEPFRWFIEEFLYPQFFRATYFLGGNLLRNPETNQATIIVGQVQICASQARAAMLRKRDFARSIGLFENLGKLLGGSGAESAATAEMVVEGGDEQASQASGSDQGLWDMGEILTEGTFRWDDFLADTALDPAAGQQEF